jgi:Flp pilus assembly pilin Flp
MRHVRVGRLGDDSGQGLVEYALILALASLGLMLMLALLRNSIGNTFQVAGNHVDVTGSIGGYGSETGGAAGGGTSGGVGSGGYGGGGGGNGGNGNGNGGPNGGNNGNGGGNGQGNSGNGNGGPNGGGGRGK